MRAISSPVTIRCSSRRHRLTDVTGDPLVVAGQDLDGDAVAFELREPIRRIRENRIQEADKASEHEGLLVVSRVRRRDDPASGRRPPARGCRPRSCARERRVHRLACAASSGTDCPPTSIAVHSAMTDSGAPLVISSRRRRAGGFDDDRETTPLEIERDLVDFW